MSVDLARRAAAECLGTAFLLAVVIGSGIMEERLAGGNVAIALLANTLATGAGLATLILTFGSISGAHFNPAVSLADATQGGLPWRHVPAYTSWLRSPGASWASPPRVARSGPAQGATPNPSWFSIPHCGAARGSGR